VLQAILIWFSAGVVMLAASVLVAAAAAAAAVAQGVPPAKLLADPSASPLMSSPLWIALGTAANELGVAVVLIAWLFALKPTTARVLPLVRPTPLAVFASLLIVFGLAPLAELAGRGVELVVRSDITATRIISEAAQRASFAELMLLMFSVAVLPGIVEEAMFRGVLTAPFAERSKLFAVIVPSILFGLFHIEPTQVAGTMVLGLGFGVARIYTGSLVPGAIAHGLYNGAVVLAVRHAGIDESRPFSPLPLLLGLVLSSLGLFLLQRSTRLALSSPATAENPVSPRV
jgi:membrane protease YdiL (CAAX protease family)